MEAFGELLERLVYTQARNAKLKLLLTKFVPSQDFPGPYQSRHRAVRPISHAEPKVMLLHVNRSDTKLSFGPVVSEIVC